MRTLKLNLYIHSSIISTYKISYNSILTILVTQYLNCKTQMYPDFKTKVCLRQNEPFETVLISVSVQLSYSYNQCKYQLFSCKQFFNIPSQLQNKI